MKMKFIDLFAGLGGFHIALDDLGHECVFACEIDKALQDTYEKNFSIRPLGDIRTISSRQVPKHDILCAGFPCQPFSKAGFQEGLRDKDRGGLFYEILRIIRFHKPSFVILENVPHIRRQNGGKTWAMIEKSLKNEGYAFTAHDLSPHQFGIPQIRLRTYIIASREGLNGFRWPEPSHSPHDVISIGTILDPKPKEAKPLQKNVNACIDLWQEFLDLFPPDEPIPKPLWSMEFGATYPYERKTPHSMQVKNLRKYRGSFGARLKGKRRKVIYTNLPSHAKREDKRFPDWKIRMIKSNRQFYRKHKNLIIPWVKKIKAYPSSYQKLEWNIQDGSRDIRKYILQFRASGVRVKKLTTAPSLVAMNSTQIPIIPWENRYMTTTECSRLQSMDVLEYLPAGPSAYKALGNAVNATVVKRIVGSLLPGGDSNA